MIILSDYQILTSIYQSGRTVAYQAIRKVDQKNVILKTQASEYPTTKELANFKHEYRIMNKARFPGVVHAYELVSDKNRLVLVLEDVGGISLKDFIYRNPLNIETFLILAIELTEIIGQLHKHHIIHKDLKPDNILINPDTLKLYLIDFSISSELTFEESNSQTLESESSEGFVGTFAYISPEQTGRMNRLVDYRSDFYSLGVTFYEMLTNQLPFQTQDLVELIFCHLTKMPEPINVLNTNVPEIVAAIVAKLMAKDADERYKSAEGLKYDLEECQRNLKLNKTIAPFELGMMDFKDRLFIPQKLYGRENDIQELFSAYERVVSQRSSELVLVSGRSGMGKSALIQEIQRPIAKRRSYFIKGKYDALQRNIPNLGYIQAFKELVQSILIEDNKKIEQIKSKLLDLLGSAIETIIEFVPELELIVGPQAPTDKLGLSSNELQNRFNFAFQTFLKVFAEAEHPLVIFLDDLQWADQSSIDLLELLITSSKDILVIGAYRQNEIDELHPLTYMQKNLHKQDIQIKQIELQPLSIGHVNQLLKDTIESSDVEAFSAVILKKTEGNPFFIKEFLKTLFQENLLRFSVEGKWAWDLNRIEQLDISDSVAHFMVDKIRKLSPECQRILSLAACIGTKFDLDTLSTISQKKQQELAPSIWEALQAGLILALSSSHRQTYSKEMIEEETENASYRFIHDKVQEAAYLTIAEEERKKSHLTIGRLLLTNEKFVKESIAIILNHYNAAIDLITDKNEKEQLAQLNFEAAKKAKASAAYPPALSYIQACIACLDPQDLWYKNYQFGFNLYKELAEIHYLLGNFSEAESLIKYLLQKAKNKIDQAALYEILINQYSNIGDNKKAVELLVEALKIFGIPFTLHPTNLDLVKDLLKFKYSLMTTSKERIENLPLMTDPYYLAIDRLFAAATPAAYMYNQKALGLMGFKGGILGLQHGFSPGTYLGFFNYYIILIDLFYKFKEGVAWHNLMAKHQKRLNSPILEAYLRLLYSFFLSHWFAHLIESIVLFQRTAQFSLETGNLNFQIYAGNGHVLTLNYLGIPLEEVVEENARHVKLLSRSPNNPYYPLFVLHDYVINILQKKELLNEAKLESYVEPIRKNEYNLSAIRCCYFFLCQLYYLQEDYDKAIDAGMKSYLAREGTALQMTNADANLLYAMSIMAGYPSLSNKDKHKYLKEVRRIHKQMKKWSNQFPPNFLHKYLLISAELAALENKYHDAAKFYEQSIEEAEAQGFIQHAAIACEAAARFYIKSGFAKLSKPYLEEAHYLFSRWGAELKVEQMEQKYPQIFAPSNAGQKIVTSPHTTSADFTTTSGHSIDFLSILKATRAISEEIVLSELLNKLMKILLENAGAQRGILILERAGNLFVEAEIWYDQENVKQVEEPISHKEDIPLSLINYVFRTHKPEILDNAAEVGPFIEDSYIVKEKPKSVVCFPIMNQSKLVGILYLENNAVTGAFLPKHIHVLELLSSQAAISLQNARLFAASRRFVPVEFLHQLNRFSLIDVQLGDQILRKMSIMFCDIRNFTTLSEGMSPEETFNFINEFLNYMEPVIRQCGGFIDKYIGDAIMALFPGKVEDAIQGAISMIQSLTSFNQIQKQKGWQPIQIGVGINTGELMLGILGSPDRIEGSVIGDSVNIASRIEGLTKVYGSLLLIGENAKKALVHPGEYSLRLIDEVRVKGKFIPIEIWEVCAIDPEPIRKLKMENKDLFYQARMSFLEKDYVKAIRLFQECIRINPADTIPKFYLQRCGEMGSKDPL